MTSRKRQRDSARKRYERWVAHQEALRAQRRRQRTVAIVVVAVLGLAAGIVALAGALSPQGASPDDPAVTAPVEPTPIPTVPEREIPNPSLALGRTWTATVHTTAGDLVLELDGAAAPQAVASFLTLAQEEFFTATSCHRLTTSGRFVLQCGDPTGTGSGGPGYQFGPIENAPPDDLYPAGTLAMARVAGDAASMGSQFFLVYADSTIPSDSAGGYTIFGRVVAGMDVLQAVAEAGIAEGTAQTPATEVTIEGVEIR